VLPASTVTRPSVVSTCGSEPVGSDPTQGALSNVGECTTSRRSPPAQRDTVATASGPTTAGSSVQPLVE